MAKRFREVTGPGYPPVVRVRTYLFVKRRIRTQRFIRESPDSPRIAILFSGGIDCTLIAYLSHLSVTELLKPGQNILNQVVQTPSNHRANRPSERGF